MGCSGTRSRSSLQAERARYIKLYARGRITEGELETYLADLENQIGYLRLLIEATETELSERRERAELADTTCAWLVTLRERVSEVEEDTPDALHKPRQRVRLLVEGITLDREGKDTNVVITYRFGSPRRKRRRWRRCRRKCRKL